MMKNHENPVARTLLSAGQAQHTGQALLTTGAGRWLTLSPDKVTLSSLPVANKVTHSLIPWSGLIGALVRQRATSVGTSALTTGITNGSPCRGIRPVQCA